MHILIFHDAFTNLEVVDIYIILFLILYPNLYVIQQSPSELIGQIDRLLLGQVGAWLRLNFHAQVLFPLATSLQELSDLCIDEFHILIYEEPQFDPDVERYDCDLHKAPI